MKLLSDRERKIWIATNVPLMLTHDFEFRLSTMKDPKDRHNQKVLKRLLKLVKEDNEQSNEHYNRLQQEHEDGKTIPR